MEYVFKNEVLAMLNRIGGCDAEEGSWVDGWDKAVGEAYHRVSNMGNCELEFICEFAKGSVFGYQLAQRQLRSLWTAYCFHNNIDCDTKRYDDDLAAVWEEARLNSGCPWRSGEELADYTLFGNFMCEEIV